MKKNTWIETKLCIAHKKIIPLLIVLFLAGSLTCFLAIQKKQETAIMVMGGSLQTQCIKCEDFYEFEQRDFETFYRPSNQPVLNNRIPSDCFFDPYFGKSPEEITLPSNLLDTADNAILNYFSILREAANPVEKKSAGCGTIGNSKLPYPISYQFLSEEFQKKLPYDTYLKTYENILHINLIKYHQLPMDTPNGNKKRFFVELETIEGNEKGTGTFVYYYGFVDLEKVGDEYKISDIQYFGENFLCAPYHGWQWDAESNVEIRYGDWCKLIKGDIQKNQKDYITRIFFDGTDGYEYCIVFFQLTNGTDLEVAQYRKLPTGSWKPIHMNVEECLENKARVFSIKT